MYLLYKLYLNTADLEKRNESDGTSSSIFCSLPLIVRRGLKPLGSLSTRGLQVRPGELDQTQSKSQNTSKQMVALNQDLR